MITLTLRRCEETALATFGQLENARGDIIAQTLERGWHDNAHGLSRIPAGQYVAHRFPVGEGHHPYDVFKLADVPGRSDIELHIGNTIADTTGCILLGANRGIVNGHDGITGSSAAFSRFMSSMRGIDTWTLVVLDPTAERAE